MQARMVGRVVGWWHVHVGPMYNCMFAQTITVKIVVLLYGYVYVGLCTYVRRLRTCVIV